MPEKLTKLQETVMQVSNGDYRCKYNNYYEERTQYCLTSIKPNSNPCYGDSGSPLMYYVNKKWYIYGIVSYGLVTESSSCLSTLPFFATQVSPFVAWSLTVTAQNYLSRNSSSDDRLEISILLIILLKGSVVSAYFKY